MGNKRCMMGHKNLIQSVIGVGMLIVLAGCTPAQDDATAIPSPAQTTQAVNDANTVATLLAIATNTAAAVPPPATAILEITPTFPPTSGIPLSEAGPWLVFIAPDSNDHTQLWAMNAEGSGLKQLTQFTDADVVRFEVNPHPTADGSYDIAFTTALYEDDPAWLHLLHFPDGTIYEVTRLTPESDVLDRIPTYDPDNPTFYFERITAITRLPGALLWSPGGSQLAFVGAIDGYTADVYLYTPSTGEIVRLTDGLKHAWNLLWSLGGRYIVHAGNDTFAIGGSIYYLAQSWAVRADGSGVTDFPGYGAGYIGWLSSDTLLMYTGPDPFGNKDLRTANVDSGIVHHIVPGYFNEVAYDVEDNIGLIAFGDEPGSYGVEGADPPPESVGTYVLKDGNLEFLSADIVSVHWSPERHTFYGGSTDLKVYEIFPETGELVDLNAPYYSVPYVSPDGQYLAWGIPNWESRIHAIGMQSAEIQVLWIDTPDGDRIQVDTEQYTSSTSPSEVEYLVWASDSKHIFFVDNDIGFFAAAPDFTPQRLPIDVSDHYYWQFEWVP